MSHCHQSDIPPSIMAFTPVTVLDFTKQSTCSATSYPMVKKHVRDLFVERGEGGTYLYRCQTLEPRSFPRLFLLFWRKLKTPVLQISAWIRRPGLMPAYREHKTRRYSVDSDFGCRNLCQSSGQMDLRRLGDRVGLYILQIVTSKALRWAI